MKLQKIQTKYDQYGITDKPFVIVKADNGTYPRSTATDTLNAYTTSTPTATLSNVAEGPSDSAVGLSVAISGDGKYVAVSSGGTHEIFLFREGDRVSDGLERAALLPVAHTGHIKHPLKTSALPYTTMKCW